MYIRIYHLIVCETLIKVKNFSLISSIVITEFLYIFLVIFTIDFSFSDYIMIILLSYIDLFTTNVYNECKYNAICD